MKQIFFLLTTAVLLISCQKNVSKFSNPVTDLSSTELSKGGDGGGNQPPVAANLQNIAPGRAYRLISGDSSAIFVSFTKLSPEGWTLRLACNDPAVQVPLNYPVPTGVYNVEPPITSTPIANSRMVTVSVSLGTETKSTTFKVFPRTATFPAPQLQSPGNGASFKNRIQVKFTWSDHANAYYHDIQITDDPTFSNPPMLEVYLNDPIWAVSYFNGLGKRYWRVRYIDASGNFGPWSAVRNFEIKN